VTDRGRPAALLLVLAGVLTGISNLLPMYTAMHTSPVDAFAFDGTLWVPSSATPESERDVTPLLNVGAPVLFTAAVGSRRRPGSWRWARRPRSSVSCWLTRSGCCATRK
jgi:hypothetical protein